MMVGERVLEIRVGVWLKRRLDGTTSGVLLQS